MYRVFAFDQGEEKRKRESCCEVRVSANGTLSAQAGARTERESGGIRKRKDTLLCQGVVFPC